MPALQPTNIALGSHFTVQATHKFTVNYAEIPHSEARFTLFFLRISENPRYSNLEVRFALSTSLRFSEKL